MDNIYDGQDTSMSWGSITWQRHRFTGRELVALGGGAFWLILMLINTGTGGIVALWTALGFMAELRRTASLTCPGSIIQLSSACLLGGFAMSLAYVFALFIPHTSA